MTASIMPGLLDGAGARPGGGLRTTRASAGVVTRMSDVRWLAYDEVAAAFGIRQGSARQLATRKQWPRREGNDGKARIGAPADDLCAVLILAGGQAEQVGSLPLLAVHGW
jgi:hypothetical protein